MLQNEIQIWKNDLVYDSCDFSYGVDVSHQLK